MSLASSFLLAITPWHINLSRTASVSTLVTFFIILGCYFFH
jgi:4-amino-4-deoxy-L-arabinose transferase-like glycosyltransferase